VRPNPIDESKVSKKAAVFKDPKMGVIRIYVNDAARAEIGRLVSDAGLTASSAERRNRSDPYRHFRQAAATSVCGTSSRLWMRSGA